MENHMIDVVFETILLILIYGWLFVTVGTVLYLLGMVFYLTYDLIRHTLPEWWK